MIVLVTGSRSWSDRGLLYDTLQAKALVHGRFVVVHGANPNGADTMAEAWAKLMQFPYRGYPAQWNAYGRAAGQMRNLEMLDDCQPDLVLAFPTPSSVGTYRCADAATQRGIPVEFTYEPGYNGREGSLLDKT